MRFIISSADMLWMLLAAELASPAKTGTANNNATISNILLRHLQSLPTSRSCNIALSPSIRFLKDDQDPFPYDNVTGLPCTLISTIPSYGSILVTRPMPLISSPSATVNVSPLLERSHARPGIMACTLYGILGGGPACSTGAAD